MSPSLLSRIDPLCRTEAHKELIMHKWAQVIVTTHGQSIRQQLKKNI
jgi:hypothetical protein